MRKREVESSLNIRYCIQDPVAKFIVPDWVEKVDFGIGLSYRPARLHRLAGWYHNLCRTKNCTTGPKSNNHNIKILFCKMN
jgi:hypothetical protein